jgi:hypothetical protein
VKVAAKVTAAPKVKVEAKPEVTAPRAVAPVTAEVKVDAQPTVASLVKEPVKVEVKVDAKSAVPVKVTRTAIDVPAVQRPSVARPGVTVPTVDLPELEVPAVTLPSLTVPAVDVPPVPTVDLPELEVPAVTLPILTVPAVTVPPVRLPIGGLPAVDLPAVQPPAVQPPGVTPDPVTAPPPDQPPVVLPNPAEAPVAGGRTPSRDALAAPMVGTPEAARMADRSPPTVVNDSSPHPAYVSLTALSGDAVTEFGAELTQALDPAALGTAIGLMAAAGIGVAASGAAGSTAPGWAAQGLAPLTSSLVVAGRSRRFDRQQRMSGWRRPRQPGFAPD